MNESPRPKMHQIEVPFYNIHMNFSLRATRTVLPIGVEGYTLRDKDNIIENLIIQRLWIRFSGPDFAPFNSVIPIDHLLPDTLEQLRIAVLEIIVEREESRT